MTDATVTHAQRPPGAPQTNELRAEELRGTSAGVTVCAVMGLTWMASVLGGLDAIVAVPVLIVGVAVAVVLMRGARHLQVRHCAARFDHHWNRSQIGATSLQPGDRRRVRQQHSVVHHGALLPIREGRSDESPGSAHILRLGLKSYDGEGEPLFGLQLRRRADER